MKPDVCPKCGSSNLEPTTVAVEAICEGVFDRNDKKNDSLTPPPVHFTLEGWECGDCNAYGQDNAAMMRKIVEESERAMRKRIAEMN